MAGPSDKIEISYEQLSTGKFIKTGDDLTITTQDLWGDSETVLLKDYFLTSPDLVTSKGSALKGNIVNLLAIDSQPLDHGMLAFEDPNAIGKITIADGPVVVQRADQLVELNAGDLIYLNDVVESKAGSVGIAFADESTISIDSGAKMVIDDFVYDPENPTTGSMNANIITGNFSFVSGQIAKTGADAMQVTTPVLTIGVRGTQVAGKANQDGEENEIVLLPNEDGTVGQVMITNQSGSVLLTEAYQATTIATALQPPTVPVILPKAIVLKKFADTISTNRKVKIKKELDDEAEETEKEKEEAEEEKEELEEEKEELEEEKEELEEEAEELEEEKEELEEKLEEIEEEKEQLEEEAEQLEEEKEQLEEVKEEILEEKEFIEEKQEELVEEVQELEEQLEDAESFEEVKELEQKLEQIEKEIEKVEEEKFEIDEKFEEIEQEVISVEKEAEKITQEVEQIFQEEQFVEQQFIEVEQKVEQVIEQVEFVEQQVILVEDKVMEIESTIFELTKEMIQLEQEFYSQVESYEQMFEEEFQEAREEYRETKETMIEQEKQEIEDKKEELQEQLENDDLSEQEQQDIEQQLDVVEQKEQVLEMEEDLFKNEFQAEKIEDIFEDSNQDFVVDELADDLTELLVEIPEDKMYVTEDMFSEEQYNDEMFQEMENIIEQQVETMDMDAFTDSMEDEFNVDNIVIDETMIVDNMVHTLVHNVQGSPQDPTDEDLYFMANDDQLEIESPNEMDDAFNQWYDEFIEDLVEETDLNVAPWLQWEENNHAKTVAESASTGTQIYDMGATDANGDQLTFSLYNDPTGKLTIDATTGIITLNEAFDDVSTDTNYNVWIQVSDGSLTDLDYLTLTVSADSQLTKGFTYGDIATWGAKFSEDTVQDNSWKQQTALIVSNSNTYSQQANAKANLEAEGFTVTEKTIDDIISGGYSEMMGYSAVFELNWASESRYPSHFSGTQVGSYSSAVKDAFEDYLQSGGSLYKAGELDGNGYNVQNQNAKDLLAQIGGNMTWSGTTGSAVAINADYLVGPDTSGTLTYSALSSAIMSTTDGSLMQSNGASAEWGPDVLNTNIQGTMMVLTDFNHLGNQNNSHSQRFKTYANWLLQENEDNSAIATYDTEYLPIWQYSGGGTDYHQLNHITEVEAFHVGDNVYIGGGMSHIDWAWDDSADTAYWAFNADMDGDVGSDDGDDHYGVIGYDADGDGDLWETTDTFDLDKIKILDDSEDYMAQDSDASGDYYFKVTPVTYTNNSWYVNENQTVTVANTTGYNGYLDLSSNTDFDNINYALIETESALISEVVVSA